MRQSLRLALGTLFAMVVVGGVTLAMLPNGAVVERTTLISAPAEVVYGQIVDMEAYQTWSPWAAMDPSMRVTYGAKKTGVGASYSWVGKESGTGTLTVVEAEPHRRIVNELDFGGQGGGVATWSIGRSGEQTEVTWSVKTEAPGLTGKIFAVVANSVIGPTFDDGLKRLKEVSEGAPQAKAEPVEEPEEEPEEDDEAGDTGDGADEAEAGEGDTDEVGQ